MSYGLPAGALHHGRHLSREFLKLVIKVNQNVAPAIEAKSPRRCNHIEGARIGSDSIRRSFFELVSQNQSNSFRASQVAYDATDDRSIRLLRTFCANQLVIAVSSSVISTD